MGLKGAASPVLKPSWCIIRADDSALSFQARYLLHILAGKFQSDASTHSVGFVDNDDPEMLKRTVYGLNILV